MAGTDRLRYVQGACGRTVWLQCPDVGKVVDVYWVALASGYECMTLDDVRGMSRRMGTPIKVFDAHGFLRGTVYPGGDMVR